MILSAQTIRRRAQIIRDLVVDPFSERAVVHGMSYGLASCGYDVRARDAVTVSPGRFKLAATVERVELPPDLEAEFRDKSTWMRRGLLVAKPPVDPGFRGHLTVGLFNMGAWTVTIPAGAPIAQLIFQQLDAPTEQAYAGKYQDQPQRPVGAREEVVGTTEV